MSVAGLQERLLPVLGEVTGADAVVDVEIVQSLWSGYGQILRCGLHGGKSDSVIVKYVRWPSDGSHPRGWNSEHSHRRKVRSYEVETAWYQRYAERCGGPCPVPRCHGVHSDGDETYLVLEDLDAAGFPDRRQEVPDVSLRACLSWLAHFHAEFLGEAPVELWNTGTYWHLETRPDELEAIEDEELKAAAAPIDRLLSETQYRTFVHGDAKLANFCFSRDGARVAAVDFQYVGGGCGIKDVAYFVSSCLNEDRAEERESEILDTYFLCLKEALEGTGKIVDFPALERDWRSLYPVAWTDFFRFLLGWSPGHWKIHRYSKRLAREVLQSL